MSLSRSGRVAGFVLSVLIVAGCTGTRAAPPEERPSRPPVISAPSGPPVYAYSTASGVHLMRGTDAVAEVGLDEGDTVTDAEWTADGARFVVATGSRLVSIDVASGESAEADCTCASIAVAAGRVFVLGRYGGTELSGYDAATLAPGPALRPKPGTAKGMLSVDGAGEKLVTFQITVDGARPLTDVVVVDPRDGSGTKVGGTGDVGTPMEAVYTPRGWDRGPVFAYVANAAGGYATGVDSVVWFDPAKADPQVVTGDGPLRAKSPDVAPDNWSSGREGLWWAEDGTLRVTARTWSCMDSGTAGRPECTDHVPPSQWGFEGKEWRETGGAELASSRELGDGSVLELGLPATQGAEDKELTLVGTSDRKVLAGDVRRLWTPSVRASGSPPEEEHQDLAERYAPMVWIARGEKNGPADAAQFVRDSDLWFDHGKICKDDEPVATEVDAERLAAGDYHHEAAAQPHPQGEDPLSCNHDDTKVVSSKQWLESSPDGPGGGKGFYLDLADEQREGDGTGSPVYWQYRADGAKAVIVYWLFYAYNDSTNNHEGDWERIAVQLEGERATGVVFWKHEQPACFVPLEDLDSADGHPVTYSAKGAHGSYPEAGNFTHVGGTDRTSEGEQWKTWRQVRHAETQPWYGYGGLWGVTGPKWFSGIPGPHEKRDLSEARTTRPCAPEPIGYFGDWVSPEPVDQPSSPTKYTMSVRLRDGRVGDVVGEVDYPGLECSGTWTLLGKLPGKLVLREHIEEERGTSTCTTTGEVELTLTDAGMHFSYVRDGETEVAASADLVRQ